jgi:hypothetical protein
MNITVKFSNERDLDIFLVEGIAYKNEKRFQEMYSTDLIKMRIILFFDYRFHGFILSKKYLESIDYIVEKVLEEIDDFILTIPEVVFELLYYMFSRKYDYQNNLEDFYEMLDELTDLSVPDLIDRITDEYQNVY